MRTVRLPCGESVPALGQGTWFLGDDPARRATEVAALREGLDRGLALIDTAEMYGDGRAERLVGEAIAGHRDDAFLVSKVLPGNAGERAAVAACEASLERLGTDRLDLYLLHWVGGVAFEETLAAFERLQDDGKIRHFGVSNLDRMAMQQFVACPGGDAVQTDQLLYNLAQRGIEWDLQPWLRDREVAIMAYSPFDHGGLLEHAGLQDFARERGMSAAQAALAWLLDRDGVLPIPKSGTAAHVAENAAALEIVLSDADRAALDALFAPPTGPVPLQIY